MSVVIAPSLLSADFARLADEVAEVERAGADLIHLDMMDGCFVPNLTFGPPVARALAACTRLPLDAHLMVADPDPLIPELAAAGVNRVAVHVEACLHLHRTLAEIRRAGMTPGIALNPATPVCTLAEALAWADYALLMSVEPGFGGQALIPESFAKLRRLAAMTAGSGVEIEVDGGVDADNAAPLAEAGATILVAGSAVFGARDRSQALAEIRRRAEQGRE